MSTPPTNSIVRSAISGTPQSRNPRAYRNGDARCGRQIRGRRKPENNPRSRLQSPNSARSPCLIEIPLNNFPSCIQRDDRDGCRFSHSSKLPAQRAPGPQFIMGELLMRVVKAFLGILFLFLGTFVAAPAGFAQIGNSANVTGTVTDPSGAVVAGATVTIHNPVSQYERSTTTDSSGNFSFPNVPFNPYHLSVTATGFGAYAQDIDVRSSVPVSVKIGLTVAGSSSIGNCRRWRGPARKRAHLSHRCGPRIVRQTSVWRAQSSSVSSLVTLSTPGVAADSNGLFHGLGDHAENSFSVDGQPITDQQSKVFSNQIPTGRDSVPGSNLRRAAGRIRRQDQPGDQSHHALRPGSDYAAWQRVRPPTAPSALPTPDLTSPTEDKIGETSSL